MQCADVVGMAEQQGFGVFVRLPSRFADFNDCILPTRHDQTVWISFDRGAKSDGVDEGRTMGGDGAVISWGVLLEELPFPNGGISRSTDDQLGVGESNISDLRTAIH